MEKSYKHLGYFLLLLIPLIFIGFYQTYWVQFPAFAKISDFTIHLHAIIAATWVIILIIQPFLIAYKKLDWHRMLGKISYFVFPLLVLSFIPGILKTYRTGEYKGMFFPIADCLVMSSLYLLAIYHKKQTPKHMRYMIASALMLLGPILGRALPIFLGLSLLPAQTVQFLCIEVILFGLAYYDHKTVAKNSRGANSIHQPYFVAMSLFALHQVVFYLLFAL